MTIPVARTKKGTKGQNETFGLFRFLGVVSQRVFGEYVMHNNMGAMPFAGIISESGVFAFNRQTTAHILVI